MNVKVQISDTEMLWRSSSPSLLVQIERERHVLSRLAAGHPLSEVLTELLTDVEASAKSGMRTSILQLTEDGQQLRHLAAPSLPATYIEAIDGVGPGEGVGSCGTAVCRGAPVYVSDIAADPLRVDFREVAIGHDLHACWSTPIKGVDGATLGTFALYYDAPRTPMPRDLESIAGITLIVSLAIERHRTNLHIQRLRDELAALKADRRRS
jgi:GAF domain-containing protein